MLAIGVIVGGLVWCAAWVLRVVLFLLWLHGAVRVALALGTRRPRVTPRDAVLCWFIPLVNLIRPYGVIRSLCRASLPAGPDYTDWLTREPWLLPAWWATMLTGNLLLNIGFSTGHVGLLFAVGLTAETFATACASIIVWSVHARQELLFASATPAPRAFVPPVDHDHEDEDEDEDDDDDDDD
jgi:hypothetical protein